MKGDERKLFTDTGMVRLRTNAPRKKETSSLHEKMGLFRKGTAIIIAIIITTEMRRWTHKMRRRKLTGTIIITTVHSMPGFYVHGIDFSAEVLTRVAELLDL